MVTKYHLDKCCGVEPTVHRRVTGILCLVQVYCGNKDCGSFSTSSGYEPYEVEQTAYKEWNEDKRRYLKKEYK